MSKYSSRIEQALWQAPLITYSAGVRTVPSGDTVRRTFEPTEVDDAYPVTLNGDGDVIPPSTIVVAGPEDLEVLCDDFSEVISAMGIGSMSKTERDREILHETQHAESARLMGATVVRFQLSIVGFNSEKRAVAFRLGCRVQDFRTTRLGVAVLTAYPEYPSPSDLDRIASLGYAGVEDVAKRAAASSLPLPMGSALSRTTSLS